jgi:hypothetical protein
MHSDLHNNHIVFLESLLQVNDYLLVLAIKQIEN